MYPIYFPVNSDIQALIIDLKPRQTNWYFSNNILIPSKLSWEINFISDLRAGNWKRHFIWNFSSFSLTEAVIELPIWKYFQKKNWFRKRLQKH